MNKSINFHSKIIFFTIYSIVFDSFHQLLPVKKVIFFPTRKSFAAHNFLTDSWRLLGEWILYHPHRDSILYSFLFAKFLCSFECVRWTSAKCRIKTKCVVSDGLVKIYMHLRFQIEFVVNRKTEKQKEKKEQFFSSISW